VQGPSPRPKRAAVPHLSAVCRRGPQRPSRSAVRRSRSIRREEPLRMPRGWQPLPTILAWACRTMRVRTLVSARQPVALCDARQERMLGGTVAVALLGLEAPWHRRQALEALAEARRRGPSRTPVASVMRILWVAGRGMSGCLSGRAHGPGGAITRAMMSWGRKQLQPVDHPVFVLCWPSSPLRFCVWARRPCLSSPILRPVPQALVRPCNRPDFPPIV
jgi:hypothetical protein